MTTGLDHASVRSALAQFAATYGKEERIAEPNRETASVELPRILELIDRDTCFLAVTHTSNVTGEVYDVQSIVREARKIKPDLFIMIDGVQYSPSGPIDVEAFGADAYVIAPYKNYGVKGCGYAHATDRLARLPHWKYLFKPDTSWDLGGVEHQSYAAWSAVVDYLCWLGRHFTDTTDRRTLVVTAMTHVKRHLEGLLPLLLHGTGNVPGLRDMKHVTAYGIGDDLSTTVVARGLQPGRHRVGGRVRSVPRRAAAAACDRARPVLRADAEAARHLELHQAVGQPLQHARGDRALPRGHGQVRRPRGRRCAVGAAGQSR